jgi:hypothetical protein
VQEKAREGICAGGVERGAQEEGRCYFRRADEGRDECGGGGVVCLVPEKVIDLETPPRQKLTTSYTTIASHAIAAYVSPIVVSSITEAIILSYLFRNQLLFTHR